MRENYRQFFLQVLDFSLIFAFILGFIIKLRFPKNTSIRDVTKINTTLQGVQFIFF